MNNTCIIQKSPATGMHILVLPEKLAQKFSDQKRVRCTINGYTFHCALMNRKDGRVYINLGRTTLKKIGAKEGTKVKPALALDTSKHQFQCVVELEEVLRTDSKAKAIFNALTDGGKRSILYWVAQPKSVDKRIERALHIAERLKLGITLAGDILKK